MQAHKKHVTDGGASDNCSEQSHSDVLEGGRKQTWALCGASNQLTRQETAAV